jgi:Transposase
VSTKSVMGKTATGRRNRSWPEALKREIVAASFAPGSSVSMVARQYDVNANQVFSWRKRYRDEQPRCGPLGRRRRRGDLLRRGAFDRGKHVAAPVIKPMAVW